MRAPFWMVARAPRGPGSETAPRTRYATRAEAEAVARQLASRHRAPFVILEVVATVYPTDEQTGQLL